MDDDVSLIDAVSFLDRSVHLDNHIFVLNDEIAVRENNRNILKINFIVQARI